jgi:DNA-binding XRE family transcriptional regulator
MKADLSLVDEKDLSVNRRIKQVRETLHFSQVQFSRIISLSSGYLAGIEVEKRKANTRLVKLISFSFNVNEKWLLSGEGEMFSYDPDQDFKKLISLYKELNPDFKAFVLKEIDMLLQIQDKK